MKRFLSITMIAVVFTALPTKAQQVLSIRETDQDGKIYADEWEKGKKGDSVYKKMVNVDVNSSIQLMVSKALLREKMELAGQLPPMPQELVTMVHILTKALETREKVLNEFLATITSFSATTERSPEMVNAFNQRIAALTRPIDGLLQADERLEELYVLNSAPSSGVIAPFFKAAEIRLKELERQLYSAPQYAGASIKIGGWLIHKQNRTPLHFDGLDNNATGEYYELERWRFLPTPEQVAQFQQLQQQLKKNELREADLKTIINDYIIASFKEALKEKISQETKLLEEKANAFLQRADAAGMHTQVKELLASLSVFWEELKIRVESYATLRETGNFSLGTLVEKVTADLAQLQLNFNRITDQISQLQTAITNAAPAVRAAAADLTALLAAKKKSLTNAWQNIRNYREIGDTRAIEDIVLSFSEEVYAFSLNDLPTQSTTDLLYSGMREAGDVVHLKLQVANADGKLLLEEKRNLTLYRIIPHIQSTVGVIFAHPLSETSISKEFQMAPYYNVLFKGIFGTSQKWKRRSGLPNTLLDLNFGLHVSSPDFDKDDVPEIGLGISGSFLKDYLQFGWAYNLFHGTPYLFLGVRLPFGALNPGGRVQGAE